MKRLGFGCALVLAACGDSGPQVPTYVVAYHLTKSPPASGLHCDSIVYENSQGQIVKVISPALPWAVGFGAPAGNFIQVSAWVAATGGAQTANLKATWTISGVSSHADSSVGTSSVAGAFTLGLSRRQL